MATSTTLEGIDRATLTPIVRRVLDNDAAEVLDWQCRSNHLPFNPATGGVYRVSGTAEEQGRELDWSVVLKVGGAGYMGDDPADPQYWKREFLAYQSGFLASLPGGIQAPRCFVAEEASGRETRLWLEDVTDAYPGKWPSELYVQVAQRLGQLSGAYLTGSPIPEHSWLSQGFQRKTAAFYAQFLDFYPSVEYHPLVRRGYPGDTLGRVMGLWAEHESLERALERLPQTICHLDAFRRNLLVRQRGDLEEVVTVDWAFVGHGAVGEELSALVPASHWSHDLTAEEARGLLDTVLDGYIAGLRDAGWTGDASLARLGYAAATALRWGLHLIPFGVTQERWYALFTSILSHSFACTVEEYLDHLAEALPLWLDLADEARELLPLVG